MIVTRDAGPDGEWVPKWTITLSDGEVRGLALALSLACVEDEIACRLIRQLPPTVQGTTYAIKRRR